MNIDLVKRLQEIRERPFKEADRVYIAQAAKEFERLNEVLAWLDERARNSTSYGSHCHAYEVAARKLRETLPHELGTEK